jgi:CRISPR-associated protein Cas4
LANTKASAAFHDLGKANDGFQKVVTGAGDQSIRHEHLSGLLLSVQEFKRWLQYNPLLDFNIVLASVISHHLKVDHAQWGQPLGLAITFRVLADRPDFSTLLDIIGAALHLPTPFRPKVYPVWSFQSTPHAFHFSEFLEEAKRNANRFEREVKKHPERLALLLAVKAALLAADSAGSGVVRVGHNLESWVKAALGEPLTAADIHRKIIIPRTRDIEAKTGKTFVLQDFQKRVSALGERGLLLAPCGSGKTLAAWHWIAARLAEKPAARVLFLYPTRATATEGFRDYVSWAPEEEAALAHGTAAPFLLQLNKCWIYLKPLGLLYRVSLAWSFFAMDAELTIRVMALHALAYCERLFYLEEVEEIRIADDAVYAGRRLHEELVVDEGDLVTITLESEASGLKGKVDCLRRRDGRLIPYEHKRGRSRAGEKGPEAWPSDRLQVCAYALLLEEHTCTSIDEARVRYHADDTTVRVPVNETARDDVQKAVVRARQLSHSIERPPVTENTRLCMRCSLAPVCLPEEERLAKDPTRTPLRLFPPDRERQTLHVTAHGSRIGRAGETLTITDTEGHQQAFPIRDIGEVVVHGYAQISTQAIHLCTSSAPLKK